MSSNISISSLSDELLLYLFSFLPIRSLARASQVCNRWKVVSEDETLWKTLCIKNQIAIEGRAFDSFRKQSKQLNLFAKIGNHSLEATQIKRKLPKDYKIAKDSIIIGDHLLDFLICGTKAIVRIYDLKNDRTITIPLKITSGSFEVAQLDDIHIAVRDVKMIIVLDIRDGSMVANKKANNCMFTGKGSDIFICRQRYGRIEKWNWKEGESSVFIDFTQWGQVQSLQVSEKGILTATVGQELSIHLGDKGTILIWNLQASDRDPFIVSDTTIEDISLKKKDDKLELCEIDRNRLEILMEGQYSVIQEGKVIEIMDLSKGKLLGRIHLLNDLTLRQIGCCLFGYDNRGNVYLIDHKNVTSRLLLKASDKYKDGCKVLFGKSSLVRLYSTNMEVWDLGLITNKKFNRIASVFVLLPPVANFFKEKLKKKI